MSGVAETVKRKKIIRFLWSRIREHLPFISGSVFFALWAGLIQVAMVKLGQDFFTDTFLSKDWSKVVQFAGLVVAVFTIDGITDFLHRFLLRIAIERSVRRFRTEIFDRLLTFSSAQSSQYPTGQAVNLVASDTLQVGTGLYIVADLIREPIVMLALLVKLFLISWELSLVCLFSIPIVALLGKWVGSSAKRNQHRYQESLDEVSAHVIESVGGLKTLHTFSLTDIFKKEFFLKNNKTYGHLIRLARAEESVSPLTKAAMAWVGAGLILMCGYLSIHRGMTLSDAMGFFIAAGLLQQPIRQLNNVNVKLQRVLAAGSRIYKMVHEPLDSLSSDQSNILGQNPAPPSSSPAPLKAVPMAWENISYRYPENHKEDARGWAVQNVSLQLEPGKKLALVGKSGSGKSTLSLLALRFLDPSQGAVTLNGKSAREWDLLEYRSYFSYVSQDIYLFNRSIRDNLLLANAKASEPELWQALEKAQLKDFVSQLPRQMDTSLGEHASKLSGGEKQRLAIARAFLKDAPLLILDEATSQLDAHSERALNTAMHELMKGRSVLIIAHRLSTIREVDEVVVMEAGHIVERGSPSELLSKSGGSFYNLWHAQGGHRALDVIP